MISWSQRLITDDIIPMRVIAMPVKPVTELPAERISDAAQDIRDTCATILRRAEELRQMAHRGDKDAYTVLVMLQDDVVEVLAALRVEMGSL